MYVEDHNDWLVPNNPPNYYPNGKPGPTWAQGDIRYGKSIKLCKGGRAVQCGWLTDKYGVSWQIVPTILGKLVGDRDTAKAQRVMQAILKMKKIDISALKKAAKN